jgi:hypothetical protein
MRFTLSVGAGFSCAQARGVARNQRADPHHEAGNQIFLGRLHRLNGFKKIRENSAQKRNRQLPSRIYDSGRGNLSNGSASNAETALRCRARLLGTFTDPGRNM